MILSIVQIIPLTKTKNKSHVMQMVKVLYPHKTDHPFTLDILPYHPNWKGGDAFAHQLLISAHPVQ